MIFNKYPKRLESLRVIFVGLFIFGCLFSNAAAERLPIKTYTVGAGLAHNNVNRIFQDAKGFLWVATAEGLSRFDGYGFTNYGTADGLGQVFINDVAIDRDGNLWVATNGGGVSRLLDAPDETTTSAKRKKFLSFAIADGGESSHANFVNRILFDAENRLWCLTDDGLYRTKQTEVGERDFEKTASVSPQLSATAALADRRGRLWFNLNTRMIEIDGANRFEYEIFQEVNKTDLPTSQFFYLGDVAEDVEGHIFVADSENVYQFIEPQTSGGRGVWRRLPVELQPTQLIRTIAPATDGGLWIGTSDGLIHYRNGRQKSYTNDSGLSVNIINAVATDREGNVWIGTHAGGLNKLAGETIVSYTKAEGLPSADVYRFIADHDGNLYAEVGCVKRSFAQIGAEEIKIISVPTLLGTICHYSHLLQDERRRWWILASEGIWISDSPVLDFKNGRLLKAAEIGLPEYHALSVIYQDADGNIWLTHGSSGELYTADAKLAGTPQFRLAARNVPADFIMRDAGGTVWLASRNKLWRLKNGEVGEIKNIENLPRIEPRSLFQDTRGRVWIGTRYNGAIVTDEPQAENPHFKIYADGLASGAVWSISEDDDGQIYLGTGRGVDRLDTATGKIRHFTNDDGIVGSVINSLFKDFQGNIWVASDLGISRINPKISEVEKTPPPIFINRILIAGEDLPLAETGDAAPLAPALSANQNNITINYIGLSFGREHSLRYQYKLEGADDDWTQAGERREVNYANLGAGDYRFLVRAINEDGATSERAAGFAFQIPRPVWQRAWFVGLTALLVGGLIYLFYRRRVSRLLEMERVRTRIATDLHDDIGANLTKIAILSEVAQRRQSGQKLNGGDNLLGSVAEISRESVSAMGDIVWAINPKKDSLIGLTRRMRSFAGEILERRDIKLEFNAPVVETDLKLDANIRRNIYLIFKESVNNIVRHSNAAAVKIDFVLADNELFLQIQDDGNGFNAAREYDGSGLLSIKKRAEDCGATLEIDSHEGSGTKIILRLKLKSAIWTWR